MYYLYFKLVPSCLIITWRMITSRFFSQHLYTFWARRLLLFEDLFLLWPHTYLVFCFAHLNTPVWSMSPFSLVKHKTCWTSIWTSGNVVIDTSFCTLTWHRAHACALNIPYNHWLIRCWISISNKLKLGTYDQ